MVDKISMWGKLLCLKTESILLISDGKIFWNAISQ